MGPYCHGFCIDSFHSIYVKTFFKIFTIDKKIDSIILLNTQLNGALTNFGLLMIRTSTTAIMNKLTKILKKLAFLRNFNTLYKFLVIILKYSTYLLSSLFRLSGVSGGKFRYPPLSFRPYLLPYR